MESREISLSPLPVYGDLTIPPAAKALVLFAHGSGSSRFSSRNRYVAGVLQEGGFATLLADLLSPEEASEEAARFDIPLLAHRLIHMAAWASRQPELRHLPVGYFGASTGAAAALVAAALQPQGVAAVVSRGGRPDLAKEHLSRVQAPTLLLVGSADELVLDWNRAALRSLNSASRLTVIPGATHLFAEAGTLEEVARLALEWFQLHVQAKEAER